MTAPGILCGNNTNNYDNSFCSIPFQQFNNAGAANNATAIFDGTYAQGLPPADYQFVPNEIIVSPTSIYKVLSFLGKGTFGQVVKCWRLSYADGSAECNGRDLSEANRVEVVALKILKCHPSYERQAQTEAAVLGRLSREGVSGRFNVVRPYEFFRHKGHSCLVFEGLDINLYEYLKSHQFKPLQLEHIRMVAQQVLVALAKLKSFGLIHADLKPENIMLVNSVQKPFHVKVIDFGSACFASQVSSTTYLQSRYYRAPEVILGLTYTEAIDVWSLGCVLAELFLGWPLYPGASEYDQMRYIVQTQGMPSDRLLKKANKTRQFFEQVPLGYQVELRPKVAGGLAVVDSGKQYRWNLKTPEAYERETGVKAKETRKYVMKSLKDMQLIGAMSPLEQNFLEVNSLKADRLCFINLLESMLLLDGRTRKTPLEALNHPFVTLSHLREIGQSRLLSRSKAHLDACHHLSPLEVEELTGRQRFSSQNAAGAVDNLTSSIAGVPGSGQFLQQGVYPIGQVFLDLPQHLPTPQVQMSYALPLPPHLPLHSSLTLLTQSGGTTAPNNKPLYTIAMQNSSSSTCRAQQHFKANAQHLRPQALQLFDSLPGGRIAQESGRACRPACLKSDQNCRRPRAVISNAASKHGSRRKQPLSKSRIGSPGIPEGSRSATITKSSGPILSNLLQQQQNQLEKSALEWCVQSCGSNSSNQHPWQSKCNRSSGSRKQNRGNTRDDVEQKNSNNRIICQACGDATDDRLARRISDSDQNLDDKVSVGDSSNCRKERVSQDSGIERATLPSPTPGNILASDLSDDVSYCSADKESLGSIENGIRPPVEAMRDLRLSDEGSGRFEASHLPVQHLERREEASRWRVAGDKRRSRSDASCNPSVGDGNRKVLRNHGSDGLEVLKTTASVTSNTTQTVCPPSTLASSSQAAQSELNRCGHHEQAVAHNVPSSLEGHVPSSLGYFPCPSHNRQQQQMNPYLLLAQQQPQMQLGQHLNPPAVYLYPPQQLPTQQSFPAPLYNIHPGIQARRPVLTQQHHPTSIILLTPEGSPSFYSVNFNGGLVQAANPAMHCGFYALGNPVVGLTDGHHFQSPYNPQAVQFIYRA